ncbi:MAG: TetR/AcrR family transcriptional regulator [Planctomycetota bacterium]
MTFEPFEWVRSPMQARSQERLERILDAAEEVIAEKGFEKATIAEIMARAESSVGIFYKRFREKEDLLRCIHDRFSIQSMATADAGLDPERWANVPVKEIVHTAIPFLVQVYRERRGLIRAFLLRAAIDPKFAERANFEQAYTAEKVADLLLVRRDEILHPDPPRAIAVGMQLVRNNLNALVLFDLEERAGFSIDDEPLGQELARAFLGYLGIQ